MYGELRVEVGDIPEKEQWPESESKWIPVRPVGKACRVWGEVKQLAQRTQIGEQVRGPQCQGGSWWWACPGRRACVPGLGLVCNSCYPLLCAEQALD